MPKYAGAEWIKESLPYAKKYHKDAPANPDGEMSPLGIAVATILGTVFQGIYHLDHKALFRVDWANKRHIEFSLGHQQLATADFNELTILVLMAHHLAVRVSIEASTRSYLKLIFHQRDRGTTFSSCHPTVDQAVEAFRENMAVLDIPEYTERHTPDPDSALINRDDPEWQRLHAEEMRGRP